MNSKAKAEHLLMFVVYRAIFKDGLARVRKPSKIKAIVQEHWRSCQSSVDGFGINKVVDILGDLLRTGVFESEAQARKEFPELFRNFLPAGVANVRVTTIEQQLSSEYAEGTKQMTAVQLDGSSRSGMFLDNPIYITKQPLILIGSGKGSTSTAVLEDEVDHLSQPCPLPKYIQHRILTSTQS